MAPASDAPTPTPAGWLGWAGHSAPSPAAAPGWLGWVAHGTPTAADLPGWLGWSAYAAPNLLLTVRLPPTQAPADTYVPLTLTLDPAAPGADSTEHRTLAYAAPGYYALSVPPGVPLTLALASSRYEASSQTVSVAPGATLELVIQLAFRPRPARACKVRRRYLFT